MFGGRGLSNDGDDNNTLLCLVASEVANKLNTRRPVHQHSIPPSGGLLEDLLFPLLTVRFKGDTFFLQYFCWYLDRSEMG